MDFFRFEPYIRIGKKWIQVSSIIDNIASINQMPVMDSFILGTCPILDKYQFLPSIEDFSIVNKIKTTGNVILNSTYQSCIKSINEGAKVTLYPNAFLFYWNEDFSNTFYNTYKLDYNLQASFSHSYDLITNAYGSFYNCKYIYGQPIEMKNVIDMTNTYYNCIRITGAPYIGQNAQYLNRTYYNCIGLNGRPPIVNNAIYMVETYANCVKLTGAPQVSNLAINTMGTFQNCYNLSGSPVMSLSAVDASYMYANCYNLKGPIPFQIEAGQNLSYIYYDCHNLTGTPMSGNNITNLSYAYYNCRNLKGDMYLGYNGQNNVAADCAFYGRDNSQRLTIWVAPNSKWNSWLYNIGTLINDTSLNWTLSGNKYFNAETNILVRFGEEDNIYLNYFNLSSTMANYAFAKTIYIGEC